MRRLTWQDVLEAVAENLTPSSVKPSSPPQMRPVSPPKTPAQVKPKVVVQITQNQQAPATPARPLVVNIPQEPNSMNSDSFFVIGSDHDICQDYVANRNNGIKSYVVLADGCSGSKDSDVGARVLVKTHELYIPRMGVMDFNEFARRSPDIYSKIIEEAECNAKALELDSMALDATIMSIISNKTGDFMATCYGDGVVALGRRDGIIETYSVSYKEGYPNYLSYQLSQDRKERFSEKTGNFKEIVLEMIDGDKEPLKQKYRSSAIFDTYLGTKNKYSWVAVLSDGVHSFMEKVTTNTSMTQEPVPTHEVIRELFAFKSFQGSFVKRRVKRFLESCKERNWTHGDDLSIGVVYLGDDI